MNQLARLFEIDRRVRAGERPCAESLMSDLGVSRRQIFIDRKRLIEEMGAPLTLDKKRGGWVYRDPRWILPALRMSEGELLAFFLSVEIARSSGNGFEDTLQSAVGKIAGSLGEFVSVDLNALRAATTYGFAPAARVDSDTFLVLHRAGAARQKVRMRYFTASRGEWNWRVVHPYHLHFARGEWILLAFDEGKDAVRSFNIARITDLTLLESHFLTQATFSAEDTVRSMFWAEAGNRTYHVVVQFDEYQARYIRERTWHPDQQIENLPEGGALLSFPASGLSEIARWILGYGRHARVLEPDDLRDLVISHIDEMKNIY